MRTGGKYDRISCTDDAHASWRNDNFNFYNNELSSEFEMDITKNLENLESFLKRCLVR